LTGQLKRDVTDSQISSEIIAVSRDSKMALFFLVFTVSLSTSSYHEKAFLSCIHALKIIIMCFRSELGVSLVICGAKNGQDIISDLRELA